MDRPVSDEYVPTAREQAFLATVEDTRHERNIINGLAPFLEERVPEDMLGLYTSNELVQLRRRMRRLEMENEILRRAAAYFAKDALPK